MVRYNRNVRYNVRLLEQVYRFRSECTVPPQVATGSTFFSFLWRISKQTKNNILLFLLGFSTSPSQGDPTVPTALSRHHSRHASPRSPNVQQVLLPELAQYKDPMLRGQGRSCRKSLTMMRPRGVGKIIWYNRDYVQPTSWGRMDCRFPLIVFFQTTKPPLSFLKAHPHISWQVSEMKEAGDDAKLEVQNYSDNKSSFNVA